MERRRFPQGGDAVRLTAPWRWGMLEPGKIGIIDGEVGKDITDFVRITFNFSCFRGKSSAYSNGPEFVSCSGGPATIATPVTDLKPTGETIEIIAWKWKGLPRAGGGENYRVEVPVWEWAPSY